MALRAFKRDPGLAQWWKDQGRCRQILLDVERRRPTAWAAIDDDHGDWLPACRDRLVATHPHDGLGCEQAMARLHRVLGELDAAHRAALSATSRRRG